MRSTTGTISIPNIISSTGKEGNQKARVSCDDANLAYSSTACIARSLPEARGAVAPCFKGRSKGTKTLGGVVTLQDQDWSKMLLWRGRDRKQSVSDDTSETSSYSSSHQSLSCSSKGDRFLQRLQKCEANIRRCQRYEAELDAQLLLVQQKKRQIKQNCFSDEKLRFESLVGHRDDIEDVQAQLQNLTDLESKFVKRVRLLKEERGEWLLLQERLRQDYFEHERNSETSSAQSLIAGSRGAAASKEEKTNETPVEEYQRMAGTARKPRNKGKAV